MLLKSFDFGIAAAALGAVIVSFFAVYAGGGGRGTISLKGEGGEWVFPADAVEIMTVSGPLGETVVAIQNGGACIVSSPCQNQTCIAAGTVHLPGQWAACLPNRVMVYVNKGEIDNDIDAEAW